MKRDMDLVRKILFEIEKRPEPTFQTVEIKGVGEEVIKHHLSILTDANFLVYETAQNKGYFNASWYRMTWQGHEFLDLMKDDTNWNKAKKLMAQTGGMAFEILVKILMQYTASQVGLTT